MKKKKGLIWSSFVAIFIIIIASLFGCAGKAEEQKDVWIPEFIEVSYGDMVDEEAFNEYDFVGDPDINAYINEVGRDVAEYSHRPDLDYTFRIIDEMDVNAFAQPGGYVYITRGALMAINDEAELAAILGHEVAHIALYHGAADAQWDILLDVTGSFFDDDTITAIDSGHELLYLGYSRDDELDADYYGTIYATSAGYDPNGMTEFLEIVSKIENEEGGWVPAFLSTHPDTEERIEAAKYQVDTEFASVVGKRNRNEYQKFQNSLESLAPSTNSAYPIDNDVDVNNEEPYPHLEESFEEDNVYGEFGEDWSLGY